MLNLRQKAFVEEYLISKNATSAAKKAGYSQKTAYSIGQRLLKQAEIKSYINDIIDKQREDRLATLEDVKRFLSTVMWNEKEKTKDRLKAAEQISEIFKTSTEKTDRELPVFNFHFSDGTLKSENEHKDT